MKLVSFMAALARSIISLMVVPMIATHTLPIRERIS
jgi:hypothetical protein